MVTDRIGSESDAIEWAEPVAIASPTKVKTQGLALSAQVVRSTWATIGERTTEVKEDGEGERKQKAKSQKRQGDQRRKGQRGSERGGLSCRHIL